MYQPGQQLEKLNLKYMQEQNENVIDKLQNQIDFLNKENQRLDRQNQTMRGDGNGNMAQQQYDQMKKDMDDLMFDNTTLKKDLAASSSLLKETQEQLNELLQREEVRTQEER